MILRLGTAVLFSLGLVASTKYLKSASVEI